MSALNALLAAGADINAPDGNGRTPIFNALPYVKPDFIRRMIDAGADLDALDTDGATPLLVALKAGNVETAIALLTLGANTEVVGFAALT